jgi:AcrR family transcriptional regulator
MSEPARIDHVRTPKQSRSQQRVDLILAAARTIIGERGSANLSIADIAAQAGVTPGSIYQYFPNRSAVLAAMAERYLEDLGQRMTAVLDSRPTDFTSTADKIDELVELFFQMNLQDPVMGDILLGLVTDKSLRDLNKRDTQAKVGLVTSAFTNVLTSEQQRDFPLTALLIVEFVEAVVRAALDLPALEARRMIDRLKVMLRAIWFSAV